MVFQKLTYMILLCIWFCKDSRYFACNVFLSFQFKSREFLRVERRNGCLLLYSREQKKGFVRSASIAITVNNSYYRDIIVLECSRVFRAAATPAALLVSGSSRWWRSEMRNRPLSRKRKCASTLIILDSKLWSSDFLSSNLGNHQTVSLSW